MGKRNRKDRYSSDSDINKQNSKQPKQTGPSADTPLSDILNKASAVLYDTEDVNSSVFVNEPVNPLDNMAESGGEPTNRDIMNCLNAIKCRLDTVEKKLRSIAKLEERFSNFEKDIKCMCLALETRIKGVEQRVDRLEHDTEGSGIAVAEVTSRVEHLEKERDNLRDDMAYLKSQSMRNNLIFTGIPEVNSETSEVTETKLRAHLQNAMKIAKEVVDSMQLERVHRSPGHPTPGKTHQSWQSSHSLRTARLCGDSGRN
ncbi:hypothetical protein DPMN_177085 [Dreissena polymorpha]|uniref:Uncharacterized protein n=1 Tax=Dreissena polymorpha TaxID=45954 RepID=A0A9D4EB29_DREPO|nr:hypothetical protein DPMN_177085 [Dreissena polymorpha]